MVWRSWMRGRDYRCFVISVVVFEKKMEIEKKMGMEWQKKTYSKTYMKIKK